MMLICIPSSEDTLPKQLWRRIYNAYGYGDVIITLGTGRLTRQEEKGLGLVGEHDYAVLDMRDTDNEQLLLVKNPWCDGTVWTGSSTTPAASSQASTWTKDLANALPAPGNNTAGTFWINFDSILLNFESLYLNWNPGLFTQRQDLHFTWNIPVSAPRGSFAKNPQYRIRSNIGGNVWVLLDRHLTTDERVLATKSANEVDGSPLGYIALYAYDHTSGHRIYLSDGPLYRGPYVDSLQTLLRLEAVPDEEYTIVIAQQSLPFSKYSFTLSTFSRDPVSLVLADDQYQHTSQHVGSWTASTAGGNVNSDSYSQNPQFKVVVPSRAQILLFLEADPDVLPIHVKLVWAGGHRVRSLATKDVVGGSGDYGRGCALAELRDVAAGVYTIVCSTFEAGQLGNFTLHVKSTVVTSVTPVLADGAGRLVLQCPDIQFGPGVDRWLAPIHVTRMTNMRAIVKYQHSYSRRTMNAPRCPIRVSIELGQGPYKKVLSSSNMAEFSDLPAGVRTTDVDIQPEDTRQSDVWLVVERLDGSSGNHRVEVEVLSDAQIHVGVWGTGNG